MKLNPLIKVLDDLREVVSLMGFDPDNVEIEVYGEHGAICRVVAILDENTVIAKTFKG